MPMHPLPIILNSGVPVALSSDNPSVFGNLGLTYDFFQVFETVDTSPTPMTNRFFCLRYLLPVK